MKTGREIAIAFSILSGAIACANIFVGSFYYLPIFACFLITLLIKPPFSTYLQIIAIYVVGIMIALTQDEFCGYAIIFIALMLMYSVKPKCMRWYLAGSAVLVYIVSYFQVKETANRLVHALLDSMFFSAYCFVNWSIFRKSIDELVKNENGEHKKYMDIISEAMGVARDAIKKLDEMRDEKNGRS
jgi:hypothetical protein